MHFFGGWMKVVTGRNNNVIVNIVTEISKLFNNINWTECNIIHFHYE